MVQRTSISGIGIPILTAPFIDLHRQLSFRRPIHQERIQEKKNRAGPHTHNLETSVQFCGIRDDSCLGDWLYFRWRSSLVVAYSFSSLAHCEGRAHEQASVPVRLWLRTSLLHLHRGTRNQVGLSSKSSGGGPFHQ